MTLKFYTTMKQMKFINLRFYPISIFVIFIIIYLSFFKPPKCELGTIEHIDKIAHFFMYFGFCSILWFEYFRSHKKNISSHLFIGAILLPILFSGAIELGQQYLTSHRGGDWYDFLFNCLGVLSAAVFGRFITWPLMRKVKNIKEGCKR